MTLPLPQLRPGAGPSFAGDALPPLAESGPVRALYIHVPFCFHKCHYCDFYSIVDTRDRQGAYVDRLERELAALAPWAGEPLDSIFVGGGTPSLLAVPLWERLLRTLRERYDLSRLAGSGEFTVECNPETVTPELAATLVAGGVNRVSMGAQSFDRRHLTTLERWHDPDNVARAATLVREAGIERLSVDLIFGIPGQTTPEWQSDLEQALALGTTHLSCYNLTYEQGTALTARLQRGEVTPLPEDLEVEMFELTPQVLARAGLDRYEVSNFAVPGQESRHNLTYWRQGQWLAAGPSASGHAGGRRWKNSPRLDDYLSKDVNGFSPLAEFEAPDPRRALSEVVMTGLRLSEGLEFEGLLSAAAVVDAAMPARLRAVASRLVRTEHLIETEGRWKLTEPGLLLSQSFIVDFMRAIDAAGR